MKHSSVLLALMIRLFDGCKGRNWLKVVNARVTELKIELLSIRCGSVKELSEAKLATVAEKMERQDRGRKAMLPGAIKSAVDFFIHTFALVDMALREVWILSNDFFLLFYKALYDYFILSPLCLCVE